jgi:hypothetical protein
MTGIRNLGERRINRSLFYARNEIEDILIDWFMDTHENAPPAPFMRIGTTRTGIRIIRGGITCEIPRISLTTRPTVMQVETEIETVLGVNRITDLFIHINRNNTIAIATGQLPHIWPEDEVIP